MPGLLQALDEEGTLGGFAGAVEAFDGYEGAPWGGGGGFGGCHTWIFGLF